MPPRAPLRIPMALAIALAASACEPYALSPPARTMPLESSATLREGQIAVQAQGGWHGGLGQEGPDVGARLRVGAIDQLEIQAEAHYAYVDYGDERSPHLGMARAGLKVAPIEHLAFTVGLGGGAGTTGGYVSPDAGIIAGYENPYLVPWVALRGAISLPVAPHEVVVTGGSSSFVLVPPETAMWQVSTGVRLPISIDREEGTTLDLYGGVGVSQLYSLRSAQDHTGVFHAELGVEIVLDPR